MSSRRYNRPMELDSNEMIPDPSEAKSIRGRVLQQQRPTYASPPLGYERPMKLDTDDMDNYQADYSY